jgi:hypothetical protein
MSDHNNTTPLDDSHSDEEITRTAQFLEAILDEMKVWDTENTEDAASGKFSLPPQPYCKSPRFKELTQQVQNIQVILRQKSNLEGGAVDTDNEMLEDPTNSPTYSRSLSTGISLSYHNFSNDIIITSSSDIITPKPFPPSPNIALSRRFQPSYSPQIKKPSDIFAPQPLPPKPNILRISFRLSPK